MKRFTPFAIFFAIAALVIGLVAPGSAASTVAQGFLATSPGPTAALAFSGQLQCEVAVNSPGTLAATPQYSSDGVTWVPATVIGNGSINQPGVYIGTNPIAAGYGFLRLNISSFSGSQLSGQLACGDNLPPANSGGTGAVSSVNGGACITVSPITGDTIVTYTCATPVPLTVDTPLVLSTPGGNTINIACPGCGGGGGGTAIAFSASATGTNYNPQGGTASSYFPSTATITPPSPPYVIRIRALVKMTSTSAHSYYGIIVSTDGTHFLDADQSPATGGYGEIGVDCSVSTCASGGFTHNLPSNGSLTAGQVVLIDMAITVASSSLNFMGASFNNMPASLAGGGASGVFLSSAVDLTAPITVYAVGGASTDVISASYSTSLF